MGMDSCIISHLSVAMVIRYLGEETEMHRQAKSGAKPVWQHPSP
jgi:hypothetical protein